MKLYDLMSKALYIQVFHIYVRNARGQNLKIGSGTKQDFMEDEDVSEEFFNHLLDEIEVFEIVDDGSILVKLNDKYYETPIEELFFEKKYVQKWDNHNPETRPWRWDTEIESWRHTITGG